MAGSFDTATQSLTVYIDGNEAGSITISEDIGYTTGNGFTIGSMQNERFFDGSIDEVSIYETALAEPDINSLKELDEVDITPPVITLNGSDKITLIQNTEYTDLGATATDNIDDVLIVDVDSSEVDTTVVGTYLVTYSATDTAGNIGLATRSVHVTGADTIAPVITLNGENPITLTVGNNYTDAGASATDNVDAVVNVSTSGTVDTSTVGIYTLTYTATDSSNNVALATRTINVEAASGFGNLIGQWHLNENAGAIASDDSGNTNDLTLNNMSNANWVLGQAGSALDFGGNSQDASRVNVSNALQTPSLTLLAWVKPDQNGLSWEWIAAQGDNYGLYINPQSRKLTFYIKNAGSGWTDVESADNAIVFDQWQHVAGSFDAATQTLKVYINGNEVNALTINEDIGYTTGNGFTIGSMQNRRFLRGALMRSMFMTRFYLSQILTLSKNRI